MEGWRADLCPTSASAPRHPALSADLQLPQHANKSPRGCVGNVNPVSTSWGTAEERDELSGVNSAEVKEPEIAVHGAGGRCEASGCSMILIPRGGGDPLLSRQWSEANASASPEGKGVASRGACA